MTALLRDEGSHGTGSLGSALETGRRRAGTCISEDETLVYVRAHRTGYLAETLGSGTLSKRTTSPVPHVGRASLQSGCWGAIAQRLSSTVSCPSTDGQDVTCLLPCSHDRVEKKSRQSLHNFSYAPSPSFQTIQEALVGRIAQSPEWSVIHGEAVTVNCNRAGRRRVARPRWRTEIGAIRNSTRHHETYGMR